MEIKEFKPSDIDAVFAIQQTAYKPLYEKIGYKRTGEFEKINEKMTLVVYEKYNVKKDYGTTP